MNAISEVLDIQQLATQILQDESLKEKDRKSMALYKANGVTVMLMALRGGAELKQHTAPGPITIQVVEGSITFIAEGRSLNLVKGEMIALDAKVPHSVVALDSSVFLLTIAIA